jgi:hypothetical protein
MRANLDAILERLLALNAADISLDAVGDAIGTELVSQAEIEALLDALKRAGRRVGEGTPDLRDNLRRVLQAARQLRSVERREPTVGAIANATGLSSGEVHAALLYASVLSR